MSTINVIEDSETDDVEEIDVENDVIALGSNHQPMQQLNTNSSVYEINRTYVSDSENEDENEDYMKSRSKIPRLHSNQDLKSNNTNTKENKSPEHEEEVNYKINV